MADTRWSVLPLDSLLSRSFGGNGGRCLEELWDRTESFSIGGGGVAEPGESTAEPSGRRGNSGMTICAITAVSVHSTGTVKDTHGLENSAVLDVLYFEPDR